MKQALIFAAIFVMALGQIATNVMAKSMTYTRAYLEEGHFLWDYYPPDANYNDLVFDQNGCFFFIYDNGVHPVVDSLSKQLCQDRNGNFGKYAEPAPRY